MKYIFFHFLAKVLKNKAISFDKQKACFFVIKKIGIGCIESSL